ncbi:MAG: hypothetical protein KJT03_23950, partial [Verrucomicrobiae bacterium]|nr:hypothetical protein [Verrucomicrobiae bacterium]
MRFLNRAPPARQVEREGGTPVFHAPLEDHHCQDHAYQVESIVGKLAYGLRVHRHRSDGGLELKDHSRHPATAGGYLMQKVYPVRDL